MDLVVDMLVVLVELHTTSQLKKTAVVPEVVKVAGFIPEGLVLVMVSLSSHSLSLNLRFDLIYSISLLLFRWKWRQRRISI